MKLRDRLGWHFPAWVIMGALLLGSFVWDAYRWASAPSGVPVVFDRVEPLNSPVHVGEPLKVRIWRLKTRGDCPVSSVRSAINEDGRPFDLPDRNWSGGDPDTEYLDTYYDTTSLPPGQYDLVVELAYACPERTYTLDQPPARFRVHNGLGKRSLEEIVEDQQRQINELLSRQRGD